MSPLTSDEIIEASENNLIRTCNSRIHRSSKSVKRVLDSHQLVEQLRDKNLLRRSNQSQSILEVQFIQLYS
jgi:phosphopantetheine adenylyltransferase